MRSITLDEYIERANKIIKVFRWTREDLQNFVDTKQFEIVFSVQGPRSPADFSQGGDFDGDKWIVIWDKQWTDRCVPMAPPEYSKPEDDVNIEIDEQAKILTSACLPGSDQPDTVREKTLEWFCKLQERNNDFTLADLDHLHRCWADKANTDWTGQAGKNCSILANLAHKALDAEANGFHIKVPEELKEVATPNFGCSRNKHNDFSVHVRNTDWRDAKMDRRVDSYALKELFHSRWPSVFRAYRGYSCGYGFVHFASEEVCLLATCMVISAVPASLANSS